ncbi:MAG: hypothetical protein AMXMBFR7_48400 [Planctomycetota bacterium]
MSKAASEPAESETASGSPKPEAARPRWIMWAGVLAMALAVGLLLGYLFPIFGGAEKPNAAAPAAK